MKLEKLILFFSTNPSAKLLRSPNSAYIIDFLNQQFKIAGNLSIPQSDLQQQLRQYLEQIHETDPNILREHAENYLTQWAIGDTRWLRRYFDSQQSEPLYQLTSHTENVLKFLTKTLEQTIDFVGTESRLTRIIETLSNIVVRGSADPKRRLEYLHAERNRIDDEIQSIEAGNVVSTHSPTAIKERFADAVSDLISLQGDFRAVEESFKKITRNVQKMQTESADSRGQILGAALDEENRFKENDQGASFNAFVQLILSQSQQDEFEKIVSQLDEITELSEQINNKERIKGMIGSLAAEADNVQQTMRRLNATLRKLLDRRSSTTRLRLTEILHEIRTIAVQRAENPPTIGIEIQTELDLFNIFQRTFWQAPIEFDEVKFIDNEPDDDERFMAFRHLAEMQRLDWDTMRSNITRLIQSSEYVTLPELLETYPLANGLIELLGYIQLAHDDGHEVNGDQIDVVALKKEDRKKEGRSVSYEIPRVVFLSERFRLLHTQLDSKGTHS